MNVATMIVIGTFGVIAVLFLADVIITVEPYFRLWLSGKLDKAFELKNCNTCKYRTTDYIGFSLNHYCIMNGKNVLRYSSCDRWERRE